MVTGYIRLPHSRGFMSFSRNDVVEAMSSSDQLMSQPLMAPKGSKGYTVILSKPTLYIYIMNQREYTWINYINPHSCWWDHVNSPCFKQNHFRHFFASGILSWPHVEKPIFIGMNLLGVGDVISPFDFSSVSPFKMNPFGRYIQFSDSPMCEYTQYTPTSMVGWLFDVGLSRLI